MVYVILEKWNEDLNIWGFELTEEDAQKAVDHLKLREREPRMGLCYYEPLYKNEEECKRIDEKEKKYTEWKKM